MNGNTAAAHAAKKENGMEIATEKSRLIASISLSDDEGEDIEAVLSPLEEEDGADDKDLIDKQCFDRLWESYLTSLDKHPVLVKSVTAFFILAAADCCGQLVEIVRGTSSDAILDVGRMLRFGLLGLLGTPFVHYYYHWLDETLPPTPERPFSRRTFVKLFIDQGIQAPLVTLIIFIFVGVLEGKNASELSLQLKQDYLSTMIANWKLFIPAQIINMAFCPPHLRVLFINVVFFFWSIILSVILHGDPSSSS